MRRNRCDIARRKYQCLGGKLEKLLRRENEMKQDHPNKGRISIRDTARIVQETNIRIEIERDGTIYRFEPLKKRKKSIAGEEENIRL